VITMPDDYTKEKMENLLQTHLTRGEGKFCIENVVWHVGISMAMFRKFLKSNVQKGILSTEKDEYGRIWYSKK
jgi:hypothetical protein